MIEDEQLALVNLFLDVTLSPTELLSRAPPLRRTYRDPALASPNQAVDEDVRWIDGLVDKVLALPSSEFYDPEALRFFVEGFPAFGFTPPETPPGVLLAMDFYALNPQSCERDDLDMLFGFRSLKWGVIGSLEHAWVWYCAILWNPLAQSTFAKEVVGSGIIWDSMTFANLLKYYMAVGLKKATEESGLDLSAPLPPEVFEAEMARLKAAFLASMRLFEFKQEILESHLDFQTHVGMALNLDQTRSAFAPGDNIETLVNWYREALPFVHGVLSTLGTEPPMDPMKVLL